MMLVELPKANVLKRWGAGFVDEGASQVVLGIIGFFLTGGILTVVAIVLSVLQDWLFGGGTSIGRKVVDQVLVDKNGYETSYGLSLARNGLRLAMWAASCFLLFPVDVCMVLFHPRGQTVVDMLLSTQVVDRAYARSRQLTPAAVPPNLGATGGMRL